MKHVLRKYFGVISLAAIAALLVACGGAPGGPGEPKVQTYTVSGIVTADGKPVRAVSISGEHAGGTAEAMSENDGTWELTGLAGSAEIKVSDPAYTQTAPITVNGAASGQTLVLTLKECNSGSITDEDDPCIITRIQQVQNIDQHLDGFFKLGADIDPSETVDWNDGRGFKPIGDRDGDDVLLPFIGDFDGAGFTIDGLVSNRPDEDYVGLFAFVSDSETYKDEFELPIYPVPQSARIHNVVLRNVAITGNEFVGALAGEADGDAVILDVAVENGFVVGRDDVGGLIGEASVEEINRASSSALVSGNDSVGGLVGDWDGTILTQSSSTGTVIGNSVVGGLVGKAEAAVSESFSIGVVNGNTSVGGLIGLSYGAISHSYSLSRVTAVGHGAKYVGGLIGDNSASIEFSFSASEVMADGATSVYGFANGNANNSYWDIDVSGVQASGAGDPKSTEDMHKQATYVGWDFDDVWEIDEGTGYPNLRNNPG